MLTKDDFLALIGELERCNQKLYSEASLFDPSLSSGDTVGVIETLNKDDVKWELSSIQLMKRDKLLKKLHSISHLLDEKQVSLLANVYSNILERDKICFNIACEQRDTTGEQLRQIKNAEKALPAYQSF